MKCQFCRTLITFDDVGRPCQSPLFPGHRPDNRHKPTGDPCRCGRAGADHYMTHVPRGNPCALCNVPAASHLPRRSGRSPKNIAALRERDGWKCQLCGEAFADPSPTHPDPMGVEVDHIVPAWKSGDEALENLRLAHRICNMRRNGGELSPAQRQRNENAREAAGRLFTGKLAEPCVDCGHPRYCHTEEIIREGHGKGGRCCWYRDPVVAPIEECDCQDFVER